MAPRASLPSQKPFQDPCTNLKVDVSGKFVGSNLVNLKENSSFNTTPCISSAGDATTSLKEGDVGHELLTVEQGFSNPWATYYGYYYPGYDACFGELDSHGYHVAGDDLNVQHAALQADDGSIVYFMPGYQAGYSPYVAVPAVGFDGNYITQSSMFPAHATLLEYFPAVVTSEGFPSHHTWDTPFFVGNGMHGGDYNTVSVNMASKGFQSNAVPIKGKFFYPPSAVSISLNGKGCGRSGKLKTHEANGFKNSSVPNEQNQGCKTANATGALASEDSAIGELGLSGENGSKNTSLVIRRDQYNLPDFPAKYDHALFFVIKSYSEDDVHKSIKYNVWASTPNGNKRLDCAFRDAQAKRGGENGTEFPVFLFFSVNASGQFCGVAEMAGPVDFMKKMDFWQQDKWNGFFPVKWHIVKDVPNPQLRHVILENNDNKPVTNSRDTQEVKFGQGMEMLHIFKRYAFKTSILDDFDFYESREKVMRDKRFQPIQPHMDLQKKVDEVVLGVRSVSLSGPENADEWAAEQRSHGAM